MHKEIDKIKELEGPPKIIKNLFSKNEINKFLDLYDQLPITVHNKKQTVIKKDRLKTLIKNQKAYFALGLKMK